MDELVEGLKKRIEEARKARGITRGKLAEGVGAGSPSTVTEWYTQGKMPAAGHVVRLPEALGVSAHWLLTGEGPMDRPAGVDDYASAMAEAAELARSLASELERRAGVAPGPKEEPGSREATGGEGDRDRLEERTRAAVDASKPPRDGQRSA